MKQTTLLIILDGWGLRDENAGDAESAKKSGNAVWLAPTPNWDRLCAEAPKRSLITSGAAVGLPDGQMGNSEVGHLNIGAGRVIYQNLLRINRSINEGELAKNPVLQNLFAKQSGRLHLAGLLSEGGVHSHELHLFALCRILAPLVHQKKIADFGVHVFTDGRDTDQKSALASLRRLESCLARIGAGTIASVSGRYYAMDRDKRWERTQRTYNAMTDNKHPPTAKSAEEGLNLAYAQGLTDEFVEPFRIADAPVVRPEDALISFNFRADRMRQLTSALVAPDFTQWQRPCVLAQEQVVTMTPYDENLPLECLFKTKTPAHVLGEVLAEAGKTQLRLAETEKFAHVTYFFNGGREAPFPNEERLLIPSLKVATYDLAPQMRAAEITDALCQAIAGGEYDFILCNYANGDMVGHSGKQEAAIAAVTTLDECLGKLITQIDASGAQALITADHGNCEQMITDKGLPHTAHTLNPVPLIYYGPKNVVLHNQAAGLSSLAPSILQLMGLPQPKEMSGVSLFTSGV